MNIMRTAVLLAALTALFLIVGAALGGRGGMMIALVFGHRHECFCVLEFRPHGAVGCRRA